MKRGVWILATLLLAGMQFSAKAAEITLSCGATGISLELCKKGAADWEQASGHKVKVVSAPSSTTERLSLYQQQLAAGSSDIDVFQIDVVWPAMLKNHFIDLKRYTKGAEAAHFRAIVDNNTVGGKLIAMPWYTDAGLLFYRKDLLEKHGAKAPTTWSDMAEVAAKIQAAERKAGNDKMWGFVWQGRAYEGLTCNALEWITSYGGELLDGAGKVKVKTPEVIQALKTAASWVGTISPEGVLNYNEEDARGVFQSGNAVFMRNWPYAWALANKDESSLKGKVAVMPLPRGGMLGRQAATLGGWQLAVSRYSKNQDAAADLVMFLTRAAEQKRRAIEGAYNPTIPELYWDDDIKKANPFFGELSAVLKSAVARPSSQAGPKYSRVSNEFWNAVHAVLSKTKTPEKAVADLEQTLNRILRD